MVTKKNLWFLTLFSIILVMAVYYISIPADEISSLVSAEVSNNETNVSVNESSTIMALKVSRDENLEHEVSAIKDILTSSSKSTEEKNEAYETLKYLNTTKGKEESLEKKIKDTFNFDSFVSIDGNKIKVVLDTKEHSYELANKIINVIEKEFDNKVYTTVSFSSK